VGRQLVVGELPQHHGLLLGQDARVQQLREHALDAVGVLAHVFHEQDAATHRGQIRRTHQPVSTARLPPQRVAFFTYMSATAGLPSACGFSRAMRQPAPSPWPVSRSSKQASMMSSGSPSTPKSPINPGPAQVTAPVCASTALWNAVKSLRPTNFMPLVDGLGHGLVADARQDAREAISPSRDQRHVGPAGRCAVNGGKARGVITGKARVHGLGIGVHFHLVAHGLQARNAALERGLVADGASGRVDVDVLGAVVVFAVRRVVVVGQSVQARQRPAP
jgi:hypothetical protein